MTAVLLINADYTPMHTVSLKRAISLMAKGKVDIVESVPDRVLRSPSVTWSFPSVLRLRYYRNVPRRKMVWSRHAVFTRDNYTCVYCGRKVSREEATLDHLTPRETCKKMGIKASTWTNTCCACAACNARKANRSLRDSGMKFFNPDFEPRTPRTNYLVMSGEVPKEWKAYLQT